VRRLGQKRGLKPGLVMQACNPVCGRQRWEVHEFETSLSYIAKSCLKKPKSKAKTIATTINKKGKDLKNELRP
jgi:hypothetical protein